MPRSTSLHGTHFILLEFPDEIINARWRSASIELANEQIVEERTAVVDIRTYDGQIYYEHQASAFESDAG